MYKKLFSIAVYIIILIALSNCKKIDHEAYTYYRTDINTTDLSTKADGFLFGGSATLDPNLNEETRDWEIVKITLTETKLTITEANLKDMLMSYNLELKVTNDKTGKSITHIMDGINSLSVDNSFIIPDNPTNNAFFKEMIGKRKTHTVEIKGYASQKDSLLKFNFKVGALVALK